MNADDLIYLTPYLPQWADMAALEIKQIKNILQDLDIEKIEHIGSTAVPGLASKPVIDIAIKVGRIENGKDAIRPLESFGYLYLAENSDEKHMFFVKGLPPHGDGRTHHLHFYERDWFDRHTKFRDTLINNSKLLKQYEDLKVNLALKFKHNRKAYTDGKSDFIERVLKEYS